MFQSRPCYGKFKREYPWFSVKFPTVHYIFFMINWACAFIIFSTLWYCWLLSNVFWVCAAIWLPTTSYSIVRTTGAYWSRNIIWKSLYMLHYHNLFENIGRMYHFQFCQYFLCGMKIILCFLHFCSKSILGNKDNGRTEDSTYCAFRFTWSQKQG